MHRLRMQESADLRELLMWLQRLAAPLARRGVIAFMQVDDPTAPTYIDVHFDGCAPNEPPHQLLSALLCRFVYGRWQYCYIQQHLAREHHYLSKDEVEYLTGCSFARSVHFSKEQKMDEECEDAQFFDLLYELLLNNPEINLDGVLRFRFAKWVAAIRNLADERVNEYLASREYEEFIDILRFFLETTPIAKETLHVVCTGNLVQGLDEMLRPIDLTKLELIARETVVDDLHPQDVLMSALITRSPERLIIHATDRELPFVRTLLRVFCGRAELCKRDPQCDYFLTKVDKASSNLYTSL